MVLCEEMLVNRGDAGWELVVRSRESGVGSRESGVGSRESGVGSQGSGVSRGRGVLSFWRLACDFWGLAEGESVGWGSEVEGMGVEGWGGGDFGVEVDLVGDGEGWPGGDDG
ncbi:MAG: hypothetical protein RI897_3115 [Verrucomicrobiota bacterium]